MITRKRLYSESWHFLALSGILYKYNKFHTALGRLSSACAKLESASFKNNKILQVNVLQKFTSHALCASYIIKENFDIPMGFCLLDSSEVTTCTFICLQFMTALNSSLIISPRFIPIVTVFPI